MFLRACSSGTRFLAYEHGCVARKTILALHAPPPAARPTMATAGDLAAQYPGPAISVRMNFRAASFGSPVVRTFDYFEVPERATFGVVKVRKVGGARIVFIRRAAQVLFLVQGPMRKKSLGVWSVNYPTAPDPAHRKSARSCSRCRCPASRSRKSVFGKRCIPPLARGDRRRCWLRLRLLKRDGSAVLLTSSGTCCLFNILLRPKTRAGFAIVGFRTVVCWPTRACTKVGAGCLFSAKVQHRCTLETWKKAGGKGSSSFKGSLGGAGPDFGC